MNKKLIILPWILLIVISFIWGSSFILMKKGLEAFNPYQVSAIRIFIASLVFIPYALWNIKELTKKLMIDILIVAYIGIFIPPFLLTNAEMVINSSTAGVLNSLTPLFVLVTGYFFYHSRMNIFKIIGVLVGLGGTLILFSGMEMDFNVHASLVIIASFCYALSANLQKTRLQEINTLHLTAFMFLLMGPTAAIYLVFSDVKTVFENHPLAWQSFGYILILALVGTSVAYFLFNKLIQKSSPIFAQSVTYLMPLVAIIWGMMDGEKLFTKDFFGSILILTGVFLINFQIRISVKT